jgi:DNA-binding MarR family transcriptional regulator
MASTAANTLSLAHELRETLGRVVRRLRAESGPPVAILTVLGRLDRQGPASTSDLAAAERMRPQSMAETIHELETAGLLKRVPDASDKRRWLVELTEAGQAKLQATRTAREDWLNDTLDRHLTANERDLLQRAVALLNRIAEA